MANTSSEDRRDEAAKEMVHKTKLIQFLGRTTPIILQNDNGPCPLLAICNVLLLRNNLNLSSDVAEVSQEKLLSLVAERLIDSNSNVNNKDAGYVENQQQNIADAIDLLPRLTTGIDVNIRFRKISDFEFTRECAIFDLLDIPLYHGWIVDPQDSETASAIGVKSYNTLMSELVALETQNLQSESQKNAEEDSVDFVAATTASLGVPSPSLSRGKSFDDSSHSACEAPLKRKGDHEEEDELLRALKMSESEFSTSANDVNAVNTVEESLSVNTNSVNLMKLEHVNVAVTLENSGAESQKSSLHQPLISKDENVLNNYDKDLITFDTIPGQDTFLPLEAGKGNPDCQLNTDASESDKLDDKDIVDTSVEGENMLVALSGSHTPSLDTLVHDSGCDEKIEDQSILTADIHETQDVKSSCDTSDVSRLSPPNAMLESCNGMKEDTDVPEAFIASANGNEPIYEGEECILETASTSYEDREPMYEGEVVLAEQVDRGSSSADGMRPKDGISPREGELIKSFLRNSASQLTIYGLFCLQDGLKERELCVFFRNNHFNTMFKIDGELYLLATDQGYINQTDLVWEKLNEVNGDTLFMTSNFKEFKVENQETSSWDEQNAMANTADYLASMDSSAQANTNFNSDLQLAIALQQQEFEQQPQSQRNAPQSNVSGGSRLVTGPPQPTRPSGAKSSSSRQEQPKSSKEKCVVM